MTMSRVDQYVTFFELPLLPQIGNFGEALATMVAPVRGEGMAK
jgi:hypothetical protein